MERNKQIEAINDLNVSDDLFLKQLGKFIRRMRKAAGFPTIRSFVDTIDMSYSQYQGYEAGKNITIKVLKFILSQLNLKVENWLNTDIFNIDLNDPKVTDNLKEVRIKQVIDQVKKIETTNDILNIRTIEIQRYIDILINCHIPRKRSYILKQIIKLDDTYNTFIRVAGKLIEYGWLDYTDKKNKNSPSQSYYTTEAGKKVLRLG